MLWDTYLNGLFAGKGFTGTGMIVQVMGIWITVLMLDYFYWLMGAFLQGIGTAMVYPTLLSAIGDVAYLECKATLIHKQKMRSVPKGI